MDVVSCSRSRADLRDRRIDKILIGKWTGIPVMLLLLAVVFWITITGANYPSQLLADGLFWVEGQLKIFFQWMNAPGWLTGVLIDGMYHVLAWVVVGHAAAHGDLLPAVYPAGGFGVSAARGLQLGSALSKRPAPAANRL